MHDSVADLRDPSSAEWATYLERLSAAISLRPLIQESWERCRSASIDRDRTPLHRVSDEELRKRTADNAALLAILRHHLEWLSASLTSVPHVVYFADRDGIILDTVWNEPALLAEAGLTPGYDWSEARMGTNGAGTALRVGKPVAVVGPEHYVRAFQGCTCTAAPIRDPAGTLLGAIDVSTPNLPDVPGRLAMVAYAASMVERELTRGASVAPDDAWLRLALESSELGACDVDLVAGTVRCDARAREILGRAPADSRIVPLTRFLEIVHPADRPLAERALADAAAADGGGDLRVECRVVAPDGSVCWVRLRGRVVRQEDGGGRDSVRMVGTIADITEQKRTELELQESRRALERQLRITRTITDNTTAALALMGADGRAIFWNPAWEEMTGYSGEEIRGQVLHELIHHSHPDGAPFPIEECPIDRALPEGIAVRAYEDVFIRKDGTFFPVVCAAMPVSEEGEPVATVIEVRDVSEQKRSEQALRRSEDRFRSTFEQAAVGIAHVDLDGRWLRVNARLCEILGYPRERLAELTFQDITHPDDLRGDLALVERLLEGEIDQYRMEKRYLRPDGSYIWANLTVSLMRSTDGAAEYFIAVIEDIQQRKEMEAQLVASERHTRAVVDSLGAFVGVTTPDGVLIEANRAALEAAGLRPEDVLGRRFEDTYWWSYDPAVQRRLREAIERAAAGEASRYDVVVRLGPDHLAPIDFMISPLFDDAGRITHLVPTAIVLTERVKAEKALRESEARLRTALAAGRIGTWDIDLATGEVHRSDITDLIFGLPVTGERRVSSDYFDRVHPEDVGRVQAAVARTVETGEEHRIEYRIVHPDGSERWVISRGEAVRLENGRPIRLVGALVDESALHRAQRALRESEVRFRTLADAIPQLAWMADADGSIFWYNQRWYDYTGSTPDQVAGWGWQGVHHPDWVEGVTERYRAAVSAGVPWEDTFPLRGADGEFRWFLSRAVPMHDEQGRVVRWLGTNTDVTAQREAAVERERLYEAEQAANQAKSDFLAVMSHELRTPLNAIIGYSDLLELGVPAPLPDGSLRHVERIRLAAQHQKQLIEDVLAFSRLEAGHDVADPQTLQVDDLLREISAVIAPLAERNDLAFFLDTSDAPETIITDARKLRQILVNLLGNAVKFTPQGHIALCVAARERCVCFVVEDTGIGLEVDEQGRLFEPFWQGDRSLTRTAEGTGLGLSISRRYARMLGGDILVDSAVGEGSSFVVVLPNDPARPLVEPGWDLVAWQRRGGRERRRVD
jgi:PAS domain S-box-containing protein